MGSLHFLVRIFTGVESKNGWKFVDNRRDSNREHGRTTTGPLNLAFLVKTVAVGSIGMTSNLRVAFKNALVTYPCKRDGGRDTLCSFVGLKKDDPPMKNFQMLEGRMVTPGHRIFRTRNFCHLESQCFPEVVVSELSTSLANSSS